MLVVLVRILSSLHHPKLFSDDELKMKALST